MAKIIITKPTGSREDLNLLSAFKVDNENYIIFDSEKLGSMGLPIIYVSKNVNGKLEKINDTNEWQSVKNYLKGIISGTNFQYVKVAEALNADEAFYTPLTLPQSSFDLIRTRYVVPEDSGATSSNINLTPKEVITTNDTIKPLESVALPQQEVTPQVESPQIMPQSTPINIAPAIPVEQALSPVAPVTEPISPVMPANEVPSNTVVSSAPAMPTPPNTPAMENKEIETPESIKTPLDSPQETASTIYNIFDNDKETFLKACENMFDALASRYQKRLADLEQREEIIAKKEKEIDDRMHSAQEHLLNAEAREQVANIAHDNAQRVMDLSNLMPINSDQNQTGVI